MGLDNVIQFFNDNQFLNRCREITDLLFREGIDHSELQYRIAVTAYFLDILIGCGGGDDPHAVIAAVFHTIHGRSFGKFHQLPGPFLNDRMALFRHSRHHDPFHDVLFVRLPGNFCPFIQFDDAL